jgi:MATE family multidrug resistance protein
MREAGCAIATNVTYVLNFTLQELWVARSETMQKTYSYPDKRSFQNLGFYLKIGVPGALLTCYEWWAFEILTIFAGMISTTALGAHIIIYQWSILVFMVPLGAAQAASTLTGNFIGK